MWQNRQGSRDSISFSSVEAFDPQLVHIWVRGMFDTDEQPGAAEPLHCATSDDTSTHVRKLLDGNSLVHYKPALSQHSVA